MSFLDRIVAAITPPEDEDDRRQARAHAQGLARPGDWLSHALEHHRRIEVGALETLDPMGQDLRDKLCHFRGAVLHHVYEEEGSRFPELREAIAPHEDQRLTRRFLEEFDRYMGKDAFDAPRQMAAEIPPGQVDQSNRQPPKNWGAADY